VGFVGGGSYVEVGSVRVVFVIEERKKKKKKTPPPPPPTHTHTPTTYKGFRVPFTQNEVRSHVAQDAADRFNTISPLRLGKH